MSSDNSVAVIYHNTKWYVGIYFADNYICVLEYGKQFNDQLTAIRYAHKIDKTEYGISFFNI